jgi:ketosteroid isomerase-like protein
MEDPQSRELLQLTQQLLDCIAEANWVRYQELCDESLTAFEPEALGQRVEGLAFHHFYFQLGGRTKSQTTLANPHVRLMGDVAVVTYVRLIQKVGGSGKAVTAAFEETRVWQRRHDKWKHVHFHRSALGTTPE